MRRGGDPCPFGGRRAEELALGKLFDVLRALCLAYDSLAASALVDIAELTQEERAGLLGAYHRAIAKLREDLCTRLAAWRKLPLVICALGCSDDSVYGETLRMI